ncbi:MAG: GNAT family N-acetyltransferase [Anaerolineae bacterium]
MTTSAGEVPVTYRRATPEDWRAAHKVFRYSVFDLEFRLGQEENNTPPTDEALQADWDRRRDLYEHLAMSSDNFWVAERDGEVIGFARSIRRGHLRELTEFFVLPGMQSGGVGAELLRRAFPEEPGVYHGIIATVDVRAQSRYIKSGMFPRFIFYSLSRAPEPRPPHPDLVALPLTNSAEMIAALATLDELVLGHRRDVDHQWLISTRQGFLYSLHGQVIGYGYVGEYSGPFAVVDPQFVPIVLEHAENEAARQGRANFALEIPMVNQAALAHLLGRGYKIDPFYCYFMADAVFGQFDRYVALSPNLLL